MKFVNAMKSVDAMKFVNAMKTINAGTTAYSPPCGWHVPWTDPMTPTPTPIPQLDGEVLEPDTLSLTSRKSLMTAS